MNLIIFSLLILSLGVIIIRFGLRHRLAEKPSSTQTTTRERGVRLIPINESYTYDDGTDIDIIAIHGLDTNSPTTREYKEPDRKKVNWLAHPDMLPKTAERARIFYCDWPADLYEQPDLVQTTVDVFALLLLAGIKRRLLATDDRPILFIASCLGGVILMKALVDAGIGDDYISIRRATRGIIFLATPFRGLRSRM